VAPESDALASADEAQILAWPVDPSARADRWHCSQRNWGSEVLAWTTDGRLITLGRADDVVRVWRSGHPEPIVEWAVSPWQVLFG
jgi:hypothetical protein